MKTVGKFALAGAIALGGCTAHEKCEMTVPTESQGIGGLCDTITKHEVAEECSRLIKLMRESAMSACLTRQSGIATTCVETEEGFDCNAKK